MANSKQAAKRTIQNEKNRLRNRHHRVTMGTQLKKYLGALDSGDKQAASATLCSVISMIDKNGKRGIIHIRKADRLKSRLSLRFNRTFAE